MATDPKLRSLPSGKFTRVFDRGQPVFDASAVYAVATTVCTDKGTYYWDSAGDFGTRINTLRNEDAGTAATLGAQGTDALRQVEQLGRISNPRAEASRLPVGNWVLKLFWLVPGRGPQTLELMV